ncbi:MAG TPA: cell wall-binding repeat-containing protein [Actinomycetes bacterium]
MPNRRTLTRSTAAGIALAIGTALLAFPGAAQAAVTPQIISSNGLGHWTPGSPATPPTTWWIDNSRLVGSAQVDLRNVTPPTGVDGSLWLRMNTANDVAAVSTLSGAGGPVSGIAAASYSTYTGDPTAVAAYEISVQCATSGGTLRLTYDPTKFSNGTVTASAWQSWNAAGGSWYLDKTLNANGTTAPAATPPTGSGLQGGAANGYSLATIKSHCTATGNKVISHGLVAGPGWPATDTYADLVTFNSVQTDFLSDYATRIGGADRYATAIAASFNTFPAQGAGAVVLARGDLFPDALSGVPLAGVYGGPLLLTPPTILLPSVLVEIKRVLAPGGTVILMGGTGALSANVQTDLTAALGAGFTVKRIAGVDRFDTSLKTAAEVQARDTAIGLTFGPVMVATGRNFPDALAAGAAAHGTPGTGGVVVLSDDYALPSAVQTYLTTGAAATAQIIAVGGQAKTATAGIATASYAGVDRYATAALLAASPLFSATQEYWGLASGTTFPDALSGGAVIAHLAGPMLLTAPTAVPASTATFLKAQHAHLGYGVVFGLTGAVSAATAQTAYGYASGSGGLIPFSLGAARLLP